MTMPPGCAPKRGPRFKGNGIRKLLDVVCRRSSVVGQDLRQAKAISFCRAWRVLAMKFEFFLSGSDGQRGFFQAITYQCQVEQRIHGEINR